MSPVPPYQVFMKVTSLFQSHPEVTRNVTQADVLQLADLFLIR
jgi:hypothetical protein